MKQSSFVSEALAPFLQFKETDERVSIPTHCLYPSNTAVTVYVSGGPTGAQVSDEGRAVDELSTHNRFVQDPDRFLRRFCRPAGLSSEKGKIYSPIVPQGQLAAAVLHVANASAAAVHWGFENIKLRQRRDLRKALQDILDRSFPKDRIQADWKMSGHSTRAYHFDHIIRMANDHILLIDAVLPDANSINSHAIAHLDIHRLEDEHIKQQMVFDDEEDWKSADLNLLQTTATLVPLSNIEDVLGRISMR